MWPRNKQLSVKVQQVHKKWQPAGWQQLALPSKEPKGHRKIKMDSESKYSMVLWPTSI